MKRSKKINRGILILTLAVLAYGIYYCAISFPIIAGYGSKVMCSAVFLAGRDERQVREQDLGFFFMRLANYQVNYKDSSVTASVFGFAKRKSIYRKGLGATLISELSEEQVRAQHPLLMEEPDPSDSLPWPMGDRVTDSFPAGVDRNILNQSIDHAFREKDSSRPTRTRAVIVLYKGQLIGEKYAEGFNRNTRLMGWSMTKSVLSTIIGIMTKQGRIRLDSPAGVPEWSNPNDPRHAITVLDLLHQSSGLNFEENYTRSSNATIMLYEKADMAAYVASRPLKYKPGTFFYYSSGNSDILSRLVRSTLGDSLYYRFPYQELFYKIGMTSAVMEPDASGTFVASSYMYATARDWARFGWLYANDGVFEKDRILPEGWVRQSAVPAPAATERQYGMHFWLNAGKEIGRGKYPDAPADLFCADGYEGQYIFIIPSRNLVIVRLGLTEYNNFDANAFLREIISAVRN